MSRSVSSRLLLAVAAASYAAVFGAFVVFETPGLGIGHFFYLPICLVALAAGPRWGAGAGVLGTGLYMLAVLATPHVPASHLHSTSSAIRLVTYCGVGVLVGAYASSNRRLVTQLSALAHRDFLTGIGNARAFDEWLAGRIASGRPFALLLADVDGMKTINDRDGHAGGNEALQQVAAALASAVGAGDQLARIGGDEFALLTARSEAEVRRLCADVARTLRSADLRCSFATAQAPVDGAGAVELFRKADDRLLLARLGTAASQRGVTVVTA